MDFPVFFFSKKEVSQNDSLRRSVSQKNISFPEKQFPRRTVSQMNSFPEGQFPRSAVSKKTESQFLQKICRKNPKKPSSWDTCHLQNYPSGKLSFWETVVLGNYLLVTNLLGNCRSGKLPTGKTPLGNCIVGNYLWETS